MLSCTFNRHFIACRFSRNAAKERDNINVSNLSDQRKIWSYEQDSGMQREIIFYLLISKTFILDHSYKLPRAAYEEGLIRWAWVSEIACRHFDPVPASNSKFYPRRRETGERIKNWFSSCCGNSSWLLSLLRAVAILPDFLLILLKKNQELIDFASWTSSNKIFGIQKIKKRKPLTLSWSSRTDAPNSPRHTKSSSRQSIESFSWINKQWKVPSTLKNWFCCRDFIGFPALP